MKVLKSLVFLGFAYEIVWRESTRYQRERITMFPLNTEMRFTKMGVYGLFSNGPGTKIFFLPLDRVNVESGALASAELERMSKRWSHYAPGMTLRINIPDRAVDLEPIGRLYSTEYTSDKIDRPGDRQGRFSLYSHRFKRPIDLYADRKTKPRVWAAQSGARRIVTSGGLVG